VVERRSRDLSPDLAVFKLTGDLSAEWTFCRWIVNNLKDGYGESIIKEGRRSGHSTRVPPQLTNFCVSWYKPVLILVHKPRV